MTGVVVRSFPRADADAVVALGEFGVATVHEAAGRSGLLRPYMRPIYPGAAVAGTAVTALCAPGDNLMVHFSVETCRPGDVLVVGVMSDSTDGMIGELLATSLRAHGARGVVIDAGVRDVRELTGMRFPVWSRAISAQGTVKATAGSVNVPVVCAGQLVRPGDVIVADDDGVVCVPRERAADVAERAAERAGREDATRKRLAAGELGIDIYGLRAKADGITFLDGSGLDSSDLDSSGPDSSGQSG